MKIKGAHKEKKHCRKYLSFLPAAFRRYGTVILFSIYSVLIFLLGGAIYRDIVMLTELFVDDSRKQVSLRDNSGKTNSLESISLNIKANHFRQINNKARTATVLELTSSDYVPVIIEHKGKSLKGKIRLKGDWLDHLNREKWSFRIELSGDNTLLGMKRFSIQHPAARNWISEWFYFWALKNEDLVALNYDFINVSLNGKILGIYALEEHFEKRMLERNNRREGPIIKFSEDTLWKARARYLPSRVRGKYARLVESHAAGYGASQVDSFDTSRWLAEPERRGLHNKAIDLLESFRAGEMKPSDAFDVDQMARFLAINDLLGAGHASVWHNMRFYYNPVTSRFEPVGYDAMCGVADSIVGLKAGPNVDSWSTKRAGSIVWPSSISADREIYSRYIFHLQRMTASTYLEDLLSSSGKNIETLTKALQAEWPDVVFDPEVFVKNRNLIRNLLDPADPVRGYFAGVVGNMAEITVANLQPRPVEILGLVIGKQTTQLQDPILLPGRIPGRTARWIDFSIPISKTRIIDSATISKMKVQFRIYGLEKVSSTPIVPWRHVPATFLNDDFIRRSENVAAFEFLIRDESKKEIRFKKGSWKVEQPIIVPAGYSLISVAGTVLDLCNSSLILSYSPLLFKGTNSDPIKVLSSDGSGQGIAVINAGTPSFIEETVFSRLTNPSQNGWILTGAVTFYESDVTINGCSFLDNTSEDSVNLIRSEFEIYNSRFSGSQSDALDSDFCGGIVGNTHFENCGNDGMDVSGGEIQISDITVSGAGDKAISAGEGTRLSGKGIKISGAVIAVASKDKSIVTLDETDIKNCQYGFVSFQKKSEFGPARLRVSNCAFSDLEKEYLIEKESSLILNQRTIEGTVDDVASLLYDRE